MTPLATYPVVAYNLPTTTIARLNTYVMTKSYNTANNYNLMCASQTSNLVNYDNGIPNCQEYIYAASTLKCQLCASGYVVTADQLKCYSADQLPNCLTADSANTHKCTKCVLGFILLNVDQLGGSAPEAQCVPHVIPNCLTYSQVAVTLSAGTITINGGSNKYFQDFCSQCNPGYFRNAFGQCSPGPTPYCSTYTALAAIDTQPVCTVCFKGYVLMKVTGQTDVFHCVPSLASMGCEGKTGANYHYEYVNDGTNANVNMNCLTCDSPFNKVVALNASQTVSSGLIKTDCMFKLRIPNCQIQKDAYNSDNPTVNTNYQICTQCSHGFYLKATINKINQCFPRMNTDPNCATFVVADDLCQTCGANYYLSSDSKTCIPYPTQIQNCDQYSNMDCSRCYNATTPVYLSQGSCVTVPTASIIKDCAYYSNSSTCSQCSATFLLSNNTCVKYDVANCLVQTKTGVCDQCSSGYVFQDSSKSACATTTVTNCATLNQTTKTCLICNVGYYLKADGTCVMA